MNGGADESGRPAAPAETPPAPRPGGTVDGVLGGCSGIIFGIVLGLVGGLSLIGSGQLPTNNCGAAYGQGAIILAIEAACGVVAWFTVIRPGVRTRLRVFAGWLAIGTAVLVLVPIPCFSYSFWVLYGLASCGSH
ncbi:MAG TPA: hypothetical protein VK665_15450 [Candidatus Elarobacter sp.]|nr:hypothetical protein [Candidatus Elarobacter sp.]